MAKLTDITPKQWRCTFGHCPAVLTLTDITPDGFRCPSGDCPAVFTASSDKLIIIGKRCSHSDVVQRVGPDEAAIEVDRDMIKLALQSDDERSTS